ncbi:MAG: tetratricopeptide repeat protein [Cyanobacteria bacterium REEB67]|nr:tetratricopeptide repeat protein [Cyanobacteria bacterium REEB67]
MSLPPDQVPEELSAHEYKRLVALYTLMGRHAEAGVALTHLAGLEEATRNLNGLISSDDARGEKASGEADVPGKETGGAAGAAGVLGKSNQEFVFTLVRLLKHLAKDEGRSLDLAEGNGGKDGKDPEVGQAGESAESGGFSGSEADSSASEVDDELDPLLAMREQLLLSGLSEVECDEYIQNLKKAIKEMTHSEPPPRDVPQDLQPAEYYELGLKYKEVGWTEQARDALTLAMEIDGDGEFGKKAQRFLRSKIPRYPVPLKAEQLNIEGYNQMFMKDENEARKTFELLIREYPDFEWPYGNLGSLLIRQGDLDRAESLLQHALKINAYYINGWLHLTRVYGVQERFNEAYDCLSRVKAIDPNDASMGGIKELLDQLKEDRFN